MGVIPKSTSAPETELLRGLSTKSLPQSGCLREADDSKAPWPAPSAVPQDSGPHCPGDCRHHKGLSKALPLFSARTYSLKWPWLPMLCNSLPPCVLPAQQFVSPLGEPKSNSASQLDRLQESWELSIKPHRNSHTCREAPVQAPTMFAAWDTATPQLRFPVFNKCTGDIPIPDTLTPPVPHSEHCSEPPLRQTRQGHAIKPPKSQARKAGALLALLVLQLHSSSCVIFSDPCSVLSRQTLLLGGLKPHQLNSEQTRCAQRL